MNDEPNTPANGAIVLMSDFGLSDRFVATMKGVAFGIDPTLRIFDLTHDIEPYDILGGAITLASTIEYCPWCPREWNPL